MSRHYLLDGYNILMQMAAFKDLSLEDGRRGLIKWIEHDRPQGSAQNTVTVVFDGKSEFWGGAQGEGPIRVIFSQGSADDTIKGMVERDKQRASSVVVSNDKQIVLYARGLGAKVMSVQEFTGIKKSSRKSAMERQERQAQGDKKYISLSRQADLNKELSKIWLKEK